MQARFGWSTCTIKIALLVGYQLLVREMTWVGSEGCFTFGDPIDIMADNVILREMQNFRVQKSQPQLSNRLPAKEDFIIPADQEEALSRFPGPSTLIPSTPL